MNESNGLSERELEILRFIATGASNKEIAQKLFISTNTVKVHLRNIFAKIGVATRTEAAMYAVRIGLVAGDVSALNIADVNELDEIVAEPYPPIPLGDSRNLLYWALLTAVVFIGVSAILWVLGRRSVQGFGGNATATPTAAVRSRWQTHAKMNTARYGFGAVAFDNKIYAIAGTTSQGVTGSVELFNPERDTWTPLRSKPTPVGEVEAAVIGGKIYMPGGQLASGEATNILEIYDIDNDQWAPGAPMPVASIAPAVVAFEGRLYVFGGWDGKRYYDVAFEYDPAGDQWNELEAIPTARAYAGAAVAGGRIYVIGGRNDSGDLDVNEVFSPAAGSQSDAWESATPMPMKRAGMGLASVADTIHIVGGLDQSQGDLPSLFYSPTTNRWTILEKSLTQPITNMRLVPMETLIYALGGQSRSMVSDDNRSYQPLYTIAIPLFP